MNERLDHREHLRDVMRGARVQRRIVGLGPEVVLEAERLGVGDEGALEVHRDAVWIAPEQNVKLTDLPGQPVVEAYVPTKVDAEGNQLVGAGCRPPRAYQYIRGACVFYKDRRCAIHPVRPMECRGYFFASSPNR